LINSIYPLTANDAKQEAAVTFVQDVEPVQIQQQENKTYNPNPASLSNEELSILNRKDFVSVSNRYL
jgi:hypothetical protein